MATRDLSDFFEPWIDYPNVPCKAEPKLKTYRVQSPDAKTGLWLTGMGQLGARAGVGLPISAADALSLKLEDDEERNFYQMVLGCESNCGEQQEDGTVYDCASSTYHQMMDDEVPWAWIEKIAQDSFLFFAFNEQYADQRLQEGLGKAPTTTVPNRAERRAGAKAGRKSSPASGGTATRTRAPASTASSKRANGSGQAAKTSAKKVPAKAV